MAENRTIWDKLKLATAGAFLAFGLLTGGSVVAQDDAVDQAEEAIDNDDDGGFDDWGLLGLLGLLGLGGLARRGGDDVRTVEQRQERMTTPVVDTTRVTRDVDVDTTRVRRDDVDSVRVTRDDDIDNTRVTRTDRDPR